MTTFSLKDKVTFDQLPEQIQQYYVGPPSPAESLWLKETQAVLIFSPQPPHRSWIDRWEKTTSGWVLTNR
jgi:hypothetical protein